MNSYNSLYSLYFKKAHIACASLDLEDIRHLVPGTALSVICLYEYAIGFYVPSGNPKGITSLNALSGKNITIANREKGSTPRIYLDRFLLAALLEIVRSEDFRTILQGQTGYDVTHTGELFSL